MIIISPALLIDLQKVLNNYSYNLKHTALNELNKNKENHRYIFDDGSVKLLIEFTKKI